MLKVILLLFVAFALSRAVLRYNDKSISIREFLFWACLWSGVIILALNPTFSDSFAHALGIGRGADAVFFVSIIILYYAVFRLYVKIDRLDRDITDLTIAVSRRLHMDEHTTPRA